MNFTDLYEGTFIFLILISDLFLFQAAYLVGVSDPNSSAGQKGLVDPAQFARANQSIQMACQNLVDPACTQSQVHADFSASQSWLFSPPFSWKISWYKEISLQETGKPGMVQYI